MNKEIIFVTGNPLKIRHAAAAVAKFGYTIIPRKLDIIEPREEEPALVAAQKARQALAQLKCPLIVEDSGIFIEALNGFPKTFVHFAQSTLGVANILKVMEGITNRNVEFRQSLAYFEPGMESPLIFSYVDGGYTLADKVWEPKYEDSGDFDKILIPPGETEPLCCFTKEWRAARDIAANQETIHYRQLARYLETKLS